MASIGGKCRRGQMQASHSTGSDAVITPVVISDLSDGIWCVVFGVWRLAFGVWRLAFGVWRLASQYIAAMELSFLYAAHATYGPMHQYVLTQKFFSLPILMSSPFRHNKGRQASD